MSIETTLVKRRARYQGEIGFFPSTPMAQDDIAVAKMDEELVCRFYSPRNLEALRFLWGMVHTTAFNSDRWLDKDEAMADLKIRAGFTKVIYNDKKKQLELRPKSLTRINDEELRLLTDKIAKIICSEILPGVKSNDLRKEIEAWLK